MPAPITVTHRFTNFTALFVVFFLRLGIFLLPRCTVCLRHIHNPTHDEKKSMKTNAGAPSGAVKHVSIVKYISIIIFFKCSRRKGLSVRAICIRHSEYKYDCFYPTSMLFFFFFLGKKKQETFLSSRRFTYHSALSRPRRERGRGRRRRGRSVPSL